MEQTNGGVTYRSICIPETWCDAQGCVRPDALVSAMQDAAGLHLVRCGISLETLAAQGCLLVLLWTELRLQRPPAAGETVRLRVWFDREKHGMHPARYQCLGADGQVLAAMASWWVAIDRARRTLVFSDQIMSRLPRHSEASSFTAPMQESFPPSLPCCAERTVQRQEIDYNGHMNNAHYIRWACELPEGAPSRCCLTRLWAEYGVELLEGQRATMSYGWEADTLYVLGSRDGEASFRLKMEYTREEP